MLGDHAENDNGEIKHAFITFSASVKTQVPFYEDLLGKMYLVASSDRCESVYIEIRVSIPSGDFTKMLASI